MEARALSPLTSQRGARLLSSEAAAYSATQGGGGDEMATHVSGHNDADVTQQIYEQWRGAAPATALAHLDRAVELYGRLDAKRRRADGEDKYPPVEPAPVFIRSRPFAYAEASGPARGESGAKQVTPRIPEQVEAKGYIDGLAMLVLSHADPDGPAAGTAKRVLMEV